MKKVLPIHMGEPIGSIKTADGAAPGLSFSDLLNSLSKSSGNEAMGNLAVSDPIAPLGLHGMHSSTIRIPHVQLLVNWQIS